MLEQKAEVTLEQRNHRMLEWKNSTSEYWNKGMEEHKILEKLERRQAATKKYWNVGTL